MADCPTCHQVVPASVPARPQTQTPCATCGTRIDVRSEWDVSTETNPAGKQFIVTRSVTLFCWMCGAVTTTLSEPVTPPVPFEGG